MDLELKTVEELKHIISHCNKLIEETTKHTIIAPVNSDEVDIECMMDNEVGGSGHITVETQRVKYDKSIEIKFESRP